MKTRCLKQLLTGSLMVFLLSCVEGRSPSSNSKNLEVGPPKKDYSQEISNEMKLAYEEQKFKEVTDYLTTLFKISFTIPKHIYDKASCPDPITSSTISKYTNYLTQLNKADGKYNKAIAKINNKINAEKNSDRLKVLNEVRDNLSNERENINDNINVCEEVIEKYNSGNNNGSTTGNNGGGGDCASEASKQQASTIKFNNAFEASQGFAVIGKANDLFKADPVIVFNNALDLHSVDCATLAKQYKSKIESYVSTILQDLAPVVANSKDYNNKDLTSTNACIKEIAERTSTLINAYEKANNDKIAACNTALANVKPPVIYVGTDVGLSISTDGGKNFVNKTAADGIGRQVNSVFVYKGVIYLGTEDGVSISTDKGVKFKTYSSQSGNKDLKEIKSVYVKDDIIYATSWNKSGGVSTSPVGAISFKQTKGANETGYFVINKSISGVAIDDNAALYAASDDGLLLSFDFGETYSIRYSVKDHSIASNKIRHVTYADETIYVATEPDGNNTGKGLSISKNGEPFINVGTSQGLGSNDVRKVVVKNGIIYAPSTGGLALADVGSTTFTNFKMPYMKTGGVYSVAVDNSGVIYAATYGAGLDISAKDTSNTSNRYKIKFNNTRNPSNSKLGSLNVRSVFIDE